MTTQTTDKSVMDAIGNRPRPGKIGMTPLFSSWVYVCEQGPIHLNERLEGLTHRLMQDEGNATRRTNRGGWHYAFDFFKLTDPVVVEFHDEVRQHVQAFLNHFRPGERKKRDNFRLQGWINVNRTGDSNAIHCHPGCFLSASYYLRIPADMTGGEIVFRDPRGPAVAMYETPDIELPWVGDGVGIPVAPATGQLLLFPSWLLHSVNPFQGSEERISIAFNASNP